MSRQRRSFSPELKLDAARLVVDQGYSIAEAARSLGVGTTAICRWMKQLEAEWSGVERRSQLKRLPLSRGCFIT
ncbi:transposase [Microbulbifer sp. DLAB2-AF]|uniref:transposase n=1 Tax=Microbulbifer sp. DLAB2-AF TaxID=3243395 RepID=UPI004039CE53